MTEKRARHHRSSVWREIRDQFKREELIKRLAGKLIDNAINGIVLGGFALWTFFPREVFADALQKSAQFSQAQLVRAVTANRQAAKGAVKSASWISKTVNLLHLDQD